MSNFPCERKPDRRFSYLSHRDILYQDPPAKGFFYVFVNVPCGQCSEIVLEIEVHVNNFFELKVIKLWDQVVLV